MRIGFSGFFIVSFATIIFGSTSRASGDTVKSKNPRLRSYSNLRTDGVDEVKVEFATFWDRMLLRENSSFSSSYAYGSIRVSSVSANKTEWPECVVEKLTCSECKFLIEQEGYPTISKVEILGLNEPATLDYRLDRVRVICNKSTNEVIAIPIVG